MTGASSYPYAAGDLLENRNTYFYTPFGGQDFLHAWRNQRAQARAACSTDPDIANAPKDTAPIIGLLQRLKTESQASALPANTRLVLDRILQRFEVSKRLHDDYTAAWKPLDPERYHGMERYLLLAELLGQAASTTADLRYLNGLLKCVDTLTAASATMNRFGGRLRTILDQERDLVDRTASRSSERPTRTMAPALPAPSGTPITLTGISLAASPTARSQAYIQSLTAHGLHPEFVLLLGDHPPGASADARQSPNHWHGIPLVDLNESVTATCRRAGIPTHALQASSINEAPALEALRRLRPDTLIYSGAGGQIVSSEALGMGTRFLHMHAGHIPDYRGSTTIYYALLNGDQPTVTAIFLDAQIDTGGILAQCSYPAPDRSIDIDRAYDASIRADTLVRLLHDYVATGSFPPLRPQRQDEGATYFVIHPVLKHLTILGLPEHEHG
ncbi:Methionyl-tRNA formyltransferase OS=Castellaniella defragrans (strain DSM / CCUG 39792 / 65Phen)OX=1437824 GN=BN940_10766 PE=4 SV=1 [Castellaniella denitrificans]